MHSYDRVNLHSSSMETKMSKKAALLLHQNSGSGLPNMDQLNKMEGGGAADE